MPAVNYLTSVSVVLLYSWFFVAFLQSSGVVTMGTIRIPLGWLIVNILIFTFLLFLYFSFIFKLPGLNYIVIFTSIYMFVFNLVFMYDLYAKSLIYNRMEHLVGSFILAFLIYTLTSLVPSLGANGLLVRFSIVIIFTVFILSLGEIVELGLDYFFHEKNIGPGLWDTNLDLLMDLIGSSFFVLLSWLAGIFA